MYDNSGENWTHTNAPIIVAYAVFPFIFIFAFIHKHVIWSQNWLYCIQRYPLNVVVHVPLTIFEVLSHICLCFCLYFLVFFSVFLVFCFVRLKCIYNKVFSSHKIKFNLQEKTFFIFLKAGHFATFIFCLFFGNNIY